MSIYEGSQAAHGLAINLLKHESWLRRTKAQGGTIADWETKAGMQPQLGKVWMRELARRRVVWCWHESERECMGQWRIYGKDARVAIRSDVASVLRVLSGENKNRDIAYGRVVYLPPDPQSDIKSSAAEVVRNPIFVKNSVFAHEKEVRFILPDGPWEFPGYPIQTLPNHFVKEIVLSPFFLPIEGLALKSMIEMLWENIQSDSEKPPVRLSGALDIDNPSGQTEPGLGEKILELKADQWVGNQPWTGSDEENHVPPFLGLFHEDDVN